MAKFFSQSITNGQAVNADPIILKSVVLASAAAASTCKVYSNGVLALVVAAVANGSEQVVMPGHPMYGMHFDGPVTLDLTGAGASVRLDY